MVSGNDERTLEIEVDGREVRISRPDKVYFPELGATKFDLVSYYLEVGEHLLNTAGGRPAMLQRFPDGAAGKSFYQKRDPGRGPGLAASRPPSPRPTGPRPTPWSWPTSPTWCGPSTSAAWGCTCGPTSRPTRPTPTSSASTSTRTTGIGFDEVRAAALLCRDVLDELGLRGYPKTTGNNGLHVYLRLEPHWDSVEVRPPRSPWPASSSGASRADHRQLVEGGARQPGLRRLQPERPAQDGLRRLVRPAPHRRPGLDTAHVGRGRDGGPRRADHPQRARPAPPAGRPVGRHRRRPQSLEPLLELAARDKAAGLHDAPWPPQYPKMPDEPPRVAPSRAKKA